MFVGENRNRTRVFIENLFITWQKETAAIYYRQWNPNRTFTHRLTNIRETYIQNKRALSRRSTLLGPKWKWFQISGLFDTHGSVQCTVITNKCPRHHSVFHFYKRRKVCIKTCSLLVCCFMCSQMFLNFKLLTDFIFMVNVTFYFLRLWRNGHNLKNKTKKEKNMRPQK